MKAYDFIINEVQKVFPFTNVYFGDVYEKYGVKFVTIVCELYWKNEKVILSDFFYFVEIVKKEEYRRECAADMIRMISNEIAERVNNG